MRSKETVRQIREESMSLLPLALLLLASPVEGLKKEDGLLSSVVRVEGQLGFINENLKDDETMLSNKILPKKNTLSGILTL